MNILHYPVLGILCGTVAQLGDWAASAIKRNVGVKDFGILCRDTADFWTE